MYVLADTGHTSSLWIVIMAREVRNESRAGDGLCRNSLVLRTVPHCQ